MSELDKREYYERHYKSAQRSGLQGWGNSLIDVQVERLARRAENASVLEIGASSGEHLAFVRPLPTIRRYIALDLLPGVTNPDLARQLTNAGVVEFVQGDAAAIPFEDDTFDLSLSTCVLAHVDDPEKVFIELRRVTKKGGRIVVGMPCDPGAINRLVKVLVTYRSMRRAGAENPRLSYAREHVNAVGNLLELARHVFRHDALRLHYFPFRIPSWNANLAVTLTAIKA